MPAQVISTFHSPHKSSDEMWSGDPVSAPQIWSSFIVVARSSFDANMQHAVSSFWLTYYSNIFLGHVYTSFCCFLRVQIVSAKKLCVLQHSILITGYNYKKPHYSVFCKKKALDCDKKKKKIRKEVKLSSFVLTSINLSPNKLQSQLPAGIQLDQSVADEQREVPARVRI